MRRRPGGLVIPAHSATLNSRAEITDPPGLLGSLLESQVQVGYGLISSAYSDDKRTTLRHPLGSMRPRSARSP